MEIPFGKLRTGERFRPQGARVNESWVKIIQNRDGHNGRALHSGEFKRYPDDELVTLVRAGEKAGPKSDLGEV